MIKLFTYSSNKDTLEDFEKKINDYLECYHITKYDTTMTQTTNNNELDITLAISFDNSQDSISKAEYLGLFEHIGDYEAKTIALDMIDRSKYKRANVRALEEAYEETYGKKLERQGD